MIILLQLQVEIVDVKLCMYIFIYLIFFIPQIRNIKQYIYKYSSCSNTTTASTTSSGSSCIAGTFEFKFNTANECQGCLCTGVNIGSSTGYSCETVDLTTSSSTTVGQLAANECGLSCDNIVVADTTKCGCDRWECATTTTTDSPSDTTTTTSGTEDTTTTSDTSDTTTTQEGSGDTTTTSGTSDTTTTSGTDDTTTTEDSSNDDCATTGASISGDNTCVCCDHGSTSLYEKYCFNTLISTTDLQSCTRESITSRTVTTESPSITTYEIEMDATIISELGISAKTILYDIISDAQVGLWENVLASTTITIDPYYIKTNWECRNRTDSGSITNTATCNGYTTTYGWCNWGSVTTDINVKIAITGADESLVKDQIMAAADQIQSLFSTNLQSALTTTLTSSSGIDCGFGSLLVVNDAQIRIKGVDFDDNTDTACELNIANNAIESQTGCDGLVDRSNANYIGFGMIFVSLISILAMIN